jgi:hypothetical protein
MNVALVMRRALRLERGLIVGMAIFVSKQNSVMTVFKTIVELAILTVRHWVTAVSVGMVLNVRKQSLATTVFWTAAVCATQLAQV